MENELNAIVVDDEQAALDMLEMVLMEVNPRIKLVAKLSDSCDALDVIMNLKPDIIFLDVEMPKKNGIALAADLRAKNISSEIIFVTGFDSYSIQAFKYAAFDYLLKPIMKDDLNQTLLRLEQHRETHSVNIKLDRLMNWFSKEKIRFNTKAGFIIVHPDEVVCCEADGNQTIFSMTDGRQELITCQLGKALSLIDSDKFVRISRSVAINLDFLQKVDKQTKTVFMLVNIQSKEFAASASGIKQLMKY